jgi:NAD(P)-dependent dehydrogenase (short-subunit alcohol dehydrogenase family)
MITANSQRQPELTGQIVVVIGCACIGLQTVRRARAAGAGLVLTGRDPDPDPQGAGRGRLGALSSAAFDATGPVTLERCSGGLPGQASHVMVTAAGPAVR